MAEPTQSHLCCARHCPRTAEVTQGQVSLEHRDVGRDLWVDHTAQLLLGGLS